MLATGNIRLGVVLWANNKDWLVIFAIWGVWGMLKKIFKRKRKFPFSHLRIKPMGSIFGYLVIALIGVILWANNWGFNIISLKRDWPVILVIVGILGILNEIFKKK